MPVDIHRLPDEKIIITDVTNPLNVDTGMGTIFQDTHALRESIGAHAVIIYNTTALDVNFGDLMLSMAEHAKGVPGSVTDPHLTPLIVTTDDLLATAVGAMKQPRYGAIEVRVFPTLDQALAAAREIARTLP
ncbi:MAG: hypothetical protein SF162_16835 [bacterium]|nr:hypothetical protein [bacterium]